jgi:electron-transferring-flavoprotein dehydrogenase
MKHHPYFTKLLTGGERIAYGGRTLNEGGIQSIPKVSFPGGALIGCSAGFVNVPKIKGAHNAMKTGMLAAEAAYDIVEGEEKDMSSYEENLKKSWVWKEMREVRNMRPSFNTPMGIWGGILYSGVDSIFLKGRVPWTFRTTTSDAAHTKRARLFYILYTETKKC